MAKGLTDRQQEVLEAIRTSIERQGFPPTIRELQTELRIGSLRGVTIHLDALERKGFISRTPAGRTETGRRPRASRSIRVLAPATVPTGPDQELAYLPLLGRIHPGIPLLAGPNIQEYLAVPRGIVRGLEGCFVVRMNGDSMTGAHILAGDLAIARPAQRAENEELVAVRIGSEVTIKRYVRKGNRIELSSQNPNYAPLPLRRGDDAAVVGTLIGLIRVC